MILVTGANGFIGSCLLGELEAHGFHDFIVVDTIRPSERSLPVGKHPYKKFLQTDELFAFLESAQAPHFDGVFHMGACASTTEMDVEFLRRNNTEYSKSLFEYCTRKKVPFIYASSAAVYGDGQLGFDDEQPSEIYRPLNPYGWSKLNFDTWAEQQTQTPPRWAGLRFFNVYGPNEYHKGAMSSVIYKAFQQVRESGRLKLFRSHRPEYQDGAQLRDFVYVKDVIRWMRQIWLGPHFTNGIYNMGSGQARTWLDLAEAVFQTLACPLKIDWIDMPISIRDQYQYYTEAKMTRFLRQPVEPPQFQLRDGIHDYLQNFLLKSDPYL
jgi:ADP-L-glycero-D-manno-heptose 6-epimerase